MTTDKPDCDICGQPYRQHNISTGGAFCSIFATYRPKSSTLPDTMRDERAMIVAWLKAKNNPASDYTALCIERGDHLSGEHLKDRGEAKA